MLKTIVIITAVLIAAILIYAATKPDTFRIQRTASINAPPEKIYPFINDFKDWAAWSPYEKVGQNLKRIYSDSGQGHGAVYEWDGNKDVGHGRMEILESVPSSKVLIKLDFFEPFEAHNQAEFSLAPHAGSTQVTWAMYGPQPYTMKIMGLFFSMDKMVGAQFEKGLTDLKALAEK
jgi:uncharacterized protein YndB with AHSA1/START domain